MYRYENTGSVYRRPKIPRQGSSPDFGQHRFPFPVSQWALKQLPYTVTASFRILTGFSLMHHVHNATFALYHYTYSTRISNRYHNFMYFL